MTATRNRPRALRTLTATLVLALLATLLLAGTALAAGKPGKPTANAPKGTITTTKPAFTWSKTKGAARYELRVYKGKQLLLRKTSLKRRTWTSSRALPTDVALTWKVRASNACGAGAWSRSRRFRTMMEGSTPSALAIGDHYGGGVVAYILRPGDPGYVAGETHGLIAATADQTGGGAHNGIQWATDLYWETAVPGAEGTAIGSGAANTTAIIAQNGAGTTYAAGLARAYNGGGYSDWYLPSKDEMNELYLNRVAIGGFTLSEWTRYWSSSQVPLFGICAWTQLVFEDGYWLEDYKDHWARVRAVRAF